MDREADYGLQGAVGGRREVQAGEMLFFFVIWDSGRVGRSLWVRSGRGGQMVVANYKVHEGKEDGGSSLHPGLGEVSQTEVKGVVEGQNGICCKILGLPPQAAHRLEWSSQS